FFSSRRRHTRFSRDWSSDVCSSDLLVIAVLFYYTVNVQTDTDYLSPDPDVTIEVEASKWNWEFGYQRDGEVVASTTGTGQEIPRSEERRVGKEGNWRRAS